MSSISSGISTLFQSLSNTGSSSISSVLSSASLQSKLESAPSGDIAQLSDLALQLQQTSGLFGVSESASGAATPESLLLQAVNGSFSGTPASASGSGSISVTG